MGRNGPVGLEGGGEVVTKRRGRASVVSQGEEGQVSIASQIEAGETIAIVAEITK
jgi:membrane-bound ClpP family serine protease